MTRANGFARLICREVWRVICQFNRDLGTEDGERDEGTDWSALMSAVADDEDD